jgi:predicted signal transduction protein with EAL and GGDEF domain
MADTVQVDVAEPGHEIGDRFLVEIASRLTRTLRAGDTVARLGGDEFVLLVCDLCDAGELETALDRVLAAIAVPLCLDGHELRVTASIGVTIFPFDESDPDTLLRHADQSMYLAKQQGRNRFHLFDREAAGRLQDQHRQLERLRLALHDQELRLHYQPKVNMRTGEVVGLEALIRWQHPELGLLTPAGFLPTAERTPLIVDIGEWALREALTQMSEWLRSGLAMPVSVNIAAMHFQHADFVPRLRGILAEYPAVPARLLELEVIESVALADVDCVRSVMGACQSDGVSFALDDFGTGYSSLSYLKRLPADTLKIDQSFIRNMLDDPEDMAIIEGVIGLASVFRMGVIAEGVESAAHGLALMRLGCDLAQGYGISRPLPADGVLDWVRDYRPDPSWITARP